MAWLKVLLVAVVCLGFSMAAGCSSDSERQGNAREDSGHGVVDTGTGILTDVGGSLDGDDSADVDDSVDVGDSVDVDDSGETESLTVEAYLDEVIRLSGARACEVVFNCPEKDSPQWVESLGRSGDQVKCVGDFERRLKRLNRVSRLALLASIGAGHTTFDVENAVSCLEEMSNGVGVACDVEHGENEEGCSAEVFISTLAVGADCVDSSGCIDGFCDMGSDGKACPGTCVANTPDAKLGEPCTAAFCEAGLTCTGATYATRTCQAITKVGVGGACGITAMDCKGSLTCEGGVCTERAFGGLNADCDAESHCKAGLTCVGVAVSWWIEGTCQTIRREGDVCLDDVQCVEGLNCRGTDSDDQGLCGVLKGAGEVCDPDEVGNIACESSLNCLKDEVSGEFTCHENPIADIICELAED